jgi:hypothetical protein
MRRRDDLVWRVVDDSVVGVDPDTGRTFTIEGVGVTLWGVLADEVTADDLVAAVTAAYAVPDAVARRDVAGFVSDLRASGLLTG